jgi:hypothetical protein
MYFEIVRMLTDDRERELRNLMRVRGQLDAVRRHRPFVLAPRRTPPARGR